MCVLPQGLCAVSEILRASPSIWIRIAKRRKVLFGGAPRGSSLFERAIEYMGNTESLAVAKELASRDLHAVDTGLEELEHLREGFRRVTSFSRNAQRQHGMDKDTFREMVLSAFPRMPKTLGERLFDVLNTEHSGLLQWSELLSGLDLTQKSTNGNKALFAENQAKLLFAIYDLNDTGQLQRDVLDRFVNSPPSIAYAEFTAVLEARNPAFLVEWIEKLARHVGRKPRRAIEELQNRYNVVRVREHIQMSTRLTLEEICALEKWFQRALKGRLKLETSVFLDEAGTHLPRAMCDLLAVHLGSAMDFAQFCTVVSHCARGTRQSKRAFLFSLLVEPDASPIVASAEKAARLAEALQESPHVLDQMTEPLFLGLQRTSVDRLVDQLPVAVCSHFDCCLKPTEPYVEKAIVEARWLEYLVPHPSHVWYLLDTVWWYKWCSYSQFHCLNGTKGGDLPFPTLPLDIVQQSGLHLPLQDDASAGSRPGPMKNWNLQYRHGSRRLKLDMVVGQHFHLIPEPVYATLAQWYGGGPSFTRSYLVSTMELELYPLVLRVGRTDAKGDVTVSGEEVVVGKESPARAILHDCCHVLIVRDKKTRLWCTNSISKVLVLDDICPYDQLSQESILIVEIQEPDGSWPLCQTDDAAPLDAQLKSYSYGLVGLDNLGNTCYMSSAIQCLSHSRLLCDYFRSGHYRYDLNLTNKLGTQGKLAVAFGNLLTSLWSTNKKNVSPVHFRTALAKFSAQFDNNDQHDAQELLAFLLSGLSEDLNRVKESPKHVEQADSAGRSDSVVADEWWQNYLRREVSIIVALFMGQYKSLLSCSRCHHQSASFEPFTFLQLPLKENETRVMVLTIVFSCGRAPMRCTLELPREGLIADVKEAIARYVGDAVPVVVACINSRDHSVHNMYPDGHKLSQIKEDEQVIAYRLEEVSVNPDIATKGQVDTRLQVGDAVGVQHDRSNVPSHARIIACNPNGTYDIAFWTGKRDFGYSRTRLVQYAGQSICVNLVHRRMENATVFFTDPHVLRLFGTPLVVSVVPGRTTGYQLYSMVWWRLRRIFHWTHLPDPAQISPLTASDDDQEDHLLSSDVATVALGTHLEHTRFGFCLRLVTMDGMACSRCPWLSGCRGCLLSSHEDALVHVCGRETIAIDWDIKTMAEDYDSTEASKVEVHPSFEANQTKVETALSLDSCLKDFTAKEHLDEAYCSRCKSLTPSTKKMDLWRLPPLLVIQLKRFHYTATSRKKLRNLVHFPLKGLDLQTYLVHATNQSGLQYWRFLGGKLASADATADENAMYDLYAVVNHIGVLGGGHYVANVFSESDKKWKCFNDHLCRDIDEKDVVSPSAYILFYIRRDMKSLPIHQVFPVNATSPVSDEDIAALLRENDLSSRCVIS
ncbi:Aste57867_17538 [Aphanomyces stellatus]|uniref:ubiquitinyl hydrolase 1 n=1 Tax=Aphanomyces stellatus TaxID=120398 RepID=A0A485L885_9STRA|nr:hypothetical protein As57867_017478 [Aphanomyces stellatus]VFT94291.1 Aste57867_17538 [Aphanomyces stellatus]